MGLWAQMNETQRIAHSLKHGTKYAKNKSQADIAAAQAYLQQDSNPAINPPAPPPPQGPAGMLSGFRNVLGNVRGGSQTPIKPVDETAPPRPVYQPPVQTPPPPPPTPEPSQTASTQQYYLQDNGAEGDLRDGQGLTGVNTVNQQELEEYFWDSPMLQQSFGDFGNYEQFMSAQAGMYDSGELVKWWEVEDIREEDKTDEQKIADLLVGNPYMQNQDVMGNETISQGTFAQAQNVNTSDAMQSLLSEYGIGANDATTGLGATTQDAEGNRYQWTGTGWKLYQEAPEKGLIGQAVGIAAPAILSAGFGAGIAGGLGATGVVGGAIKGGVGSAVGGAINGDISLGGIAQGALLGGVMAGAGDYFKDTLNGQASDVGGMFGESGWAGDNLVSTEGLQGVVDKAGNFLGGNMGLPVGTEVILNADGSILGTREALGDALYGIANSAGEGLSTGVIQPSTWSSVLDSAINNPATGWVLDGATKAMNGYDDSYEENREVGVLRDSQGNLIYENGSSLPATYVDYDWANMTEDQIFSKNLFDSAVESGMWNLDEQYSFTNTDRDPNSVLTGILTTPLESGGKVENPSVAVESESETDSDSTGTGASETENGATEESETGEDAGTETGDDNGADNGTDDGKGDGEETNSGTQTGGIGGTGNGYTEDGEWVGNEQTNQTLADNNLNPPAPDDVVAQQLLELINNTSDPETRAGYIAEYQTYTGATSTDQQTGSSTDEVLASNPTARTDQLVGLLGGTQTAVQDSLAEQETSQEQTTEEIAEENTEDRVPPNTRTDQVIGLLSQTMDSLPETNEETLPAQTNEELPPETKTTRVTTTNEDPPPSEDPPPEKVEDDLPPEDQLPPNNGGGGVLGLLETIANGGIPPVWGDMYGYSTISKWQKARDRVYDGILLDKTEAPKDGMFELTRSEIDKLLMEEEGMRA